MEEDELSFRYDLSVFDAEASKANGQVVTECPAGFRIQRDSALQIWETRREGILPDPNKTGQMGYP